MTEGQQQEKSDVAKREEAVLSFWKKDGTFEKSLEKKSPKGEFVFYDGPPFATGLPHMGSLLSSIVKDVVPRYKTMRGYHVRRRWGWDCHGLPIESLIEKRLNLKTKKDILDIGIDKFNAAAKASVLEFEHEWEKYIDRVGRWVDFKNSYKTMDNTYIESVWWALKKLHERDLLYEGRKVLMYCPHCETPLAKAEIAMDNTYKDITEEAVTVKFKQKNEKNTYLLAWTTTPWTLPGNLGLAVGNDIDYVVFEKDGARYVMAKNLFKEDARIVKELKGAELVGIEYEPLFDVPVLRSDKSYKVYAADFVSTEEGTGIVHTAVMYGEDDFALGQKEGLPMVQLLNPNGTYNNDAPEFIRGEYIKKAEKFIKEELEKRGLMFERKNHTHSYPHCYRCGTALIYNAVSSWFIAIQKVKDKMLSENEKVTWVPEHLKHGRFKNIVENAPDWTISRNRFWASPLPIWKEKGGKGVMVIGSLEEIKKRVKKSGNTYYAMRHGQAEQNEKNIVSCDSSDSYSLTALGKEQVQKGVKELDGKNITVIYSSPFRRARETADLVADALNISRSAVQIDPRLGELNFGSLNNTPIGEFIEYREKKMRSYDEKLPDGESYLDAKKRFGQFLYEIEAKHTNENILIVSHGIAFESLLSTCEGADLAGLERIVREFKSEYAKPVEIPFVPLPVNADYELDLHRPYTDSLTLIGDDGKEYERIPEVVDCWVESGAMPFAEYHYPFENESEFERHAPGDFIAEYIAQTRTWFYYMHAMGVLLFKRLAFKNVVSTGTILAADGTKMSKSKGNYTDPLLVMDRYGADALRFHLMGSQVMQAEDLNFRDEDVREMANRVVGMLWNCYKFFELYKNDYDGTAKARESRHVLDTWIFARLDDVVREATERMDAFDTPSTCRAIKAFIDDYSTWYVRRSRERVKGENATDKQFALATQREVLLTLAKLVAPVMPFLADSVWRGIGESGSVHLAEWPTAPSRGLFARFFGGRSATLSDMQMVRDVVSKALEARDAAKIKVRQPLSKLTVTDPKWRGSAELGALMAEEVNVKDVVFETGEAAVALDTVITPELREEGVMRDAMRLVQDARKAANLNPGERGSVSITVPEEQRSTVQKFLQTIEEKTNTKVSLS